MSSAEQAAGSGAAAAPADSNPGASGSNVQDAAVEMLVAESLYEEGTAIMKSTSNEVDLTKAVDVLAQSLDIFVRRKGERDPECAKVYYMYGAALFTKAQEDNNVFGPDGGAAQEAAAKPEAAAASAAAPALAPGDKGKGKAVAQDEPEDEDDGEDAEGSDDDDDDAEKEDGDDEDVADIQLAWENLEMARQIYSAPPLGPSSVELAQVHLKLGQLSMEQAQLDEALADYAEALSLFRRHLEPDHRRITAVLYEIAVALELQMDYGGALGRIREALGLCGTRVAALRARAGANELAEETASLEGVLEDLRRKEEELVAQMADAVKTKDQLRQAFTQMAGEAPAEAPAFAAPVLGSSKPAADIGVLGSSTGRKRATLVPVSAGPASASASGAASAATGGGGRAAEAAAAPAAPALKAGSSLAFVPKPVAWPVGDAAVATAPAAAAAAAAAPISGQKRALAETIAPGAAPAAPAPEAKVAKQPAAEGTVAEGPGECKQQ